MLLGNLLYFSLWLCHSKEPSPGNFQLADKYAEAIHQRGPLHKGTADILCEINNKGLIFI